MTRPHLTAQEQRMAELADAAGKDAEGWVAWYRDDVRHLLGRPEAAREELAGVRVTADEIIRLRRLLAAAERDAQQAEAALADGIRAEDAAMALGAERERAAVVAWLQCDDCGNASSLSHIGDEIAAGAHVPAAPEPAPVPR